MREVRKEITKLEKSLKLVVPCTTLEVYSQNDHSFFTFPDEPSMFPDYDVPVEKTPSTAEKIQEFFSENAAAVTLGVILLAQSIVIIWWFAYGFVSLWKQQRTEAIELVAGAFGVGVLERGENVSEQPNQPDPIHRVNNSDDLVGMDRE